MTKMLAINALTLHITNNCNLRCKYCYARNTISPNTDMDFGTAKQAINFFLDPQISGDNRSLLIVFFGGEPLMKYDLIKKIVSYSKKQAARKNKKMFFQITTNGTLLTNDKLRFLKKYNFDLLLSIDGDRVSHDTYRVTKDGSGSFKLLEKHLPKIIKLPRAGARITFSYKTLSRLAHNVNWLVNQGFRWIGFAPIDEFTWNPKRLRILKEQVDLIVRLWRNKLINKEVIRILPICRFMKKFTKPNYHLHYHMHPCYAVKQRLSVIYNGDIYPCHRFAGQQALKLGNISTKINDEKLLKEFFNFDDYKADGCLSLNYKLSRNIQQRPQGVGKALDIYLEAAGKMLETLITYYSEKVLLEF